ncbi:unnamed protein product [Tuber melanosporum]|uniref:(Perigord truffle) hypothetical protein n=1 Tax=Tuber melanosporum (strain Mel28) TaxID=656061 RepID=D5GLC2_TUBMM|nr:uncharacterized protein GSTUM_00010127001 [Tuber melanosporum]CAZ85315.1 unnamed protein product [Tuber melanosporum]
MIYRHSSYACPTCREEGKSMLLKTTRENGIKKVWSTVEPSWFGDHTSKSTIYSMSTRVQEKHGKDVGRAQNLF